MPYLFKLAATESPPSTTLPSVDAALASWLAMLLDTLTSPRPILLRSTPTSIELLLKRLTYPDTWFSQHNPRQTATPAGTRCLAGRQYAAAPVRAVLSADTACWMLAMPPKKVRTFWRSDEICARPAQTPV